MLGKMAGFADGFVDGVSQFKQGLRADKFVRKGFNATKNAANEAAQESGMFTRALERAQSSGLGSKLTSNTGYKFKTEKLTGDSMEAIEKVNMANKAQLGKITESMEGMSADELRMATKRKESLLEKTNRMDDMLNTGEFQREFTMGEYAKDYFGDELYGDFRKKAAIGTGVGVGVGMLGVRYATGGNLTRNGNGDRDIVGIPLI